MTLGFSSYKGMKQYYQDPEGKILKKNRIYDLLKNWWNVRKKKNIYRYSVSKHLFPMDPFSKILENVLHKNENKMDKQEDSRSRKQGLQHRRKVKVSPGLWGDDRMTAL